MNDSAQAVIMNNVSSGYRGAELTSILKFGSTGVIGGPIWGVGITANTKILGHLTANSKNIRCNS